GSDELDARDRLSIATLATGLGGTQPARRHEKSTAMPTAPAPRRDTGDRLTQKPPATGLRWGFNAVTKRSANRMNTATAATEHCDIAGAAARTKEPRQPTAPAARHDGADRVKQDSSATAMR